MHKPATATAGIEVVALDSNIVRRVGAHRVVATFAETFGQGAKSVGTVGAGDSLDVSIIEAPPAALFGGGNSDATSGPATVRTTTLPEQVINGAGMITIPFVGEVNAAGQTLPEIETEIANRLQGKANQAQVLVRLVTNRSACVTVLGDVTTSTRMPLSATRERLLDAVVSSGAERYPLDKLTVQLTRGADVAAMPLQEVVRDTRQNIVLQAGDVIAVQHQPNSLTVLGAAGRNDEISFEGQGINLVQALARSGGLNDSLANARGVFIFRFEPAGLLHWPSQPVGHMPDGKVPVIYSLDLTNPAGLFLAKSFAMKNRDVLYVATAPAAELQKFLSIVGSIVSPGLSLAATTSNATVVR